MPSPALAGTALFFTVTLALAALTGQAAGGGARPHAREPAPAPREALAPALAALGGADLVVVEPPAAGAAPAALVATRVRAAPAALAAVLGDPRAYPSAIPSLVRADIVARQRPPGGGDEQLLVAWELEIPLFNLAGKAWLSRRADAVDLTLVEGDLAPGRLSFFWTAAPAEAGAGAPREETILALESWANVRSAGWLFRRIASRSPFGEAAVNLTAAWVVLRAAATCAEHPNDAAARRARATPSPPPADALDARALAGAALAPFRARGAVGLVRRAATGRLASIAIAVPIALPPEALAPRLLAPDGWLALPGWHRVKPLDGDRIEVRDNLPLVDFDATWQLRRTPVGAGGATAVAGGGAVAIAGDTRGAMVGWQVLPAPGDARGSLAILSLYPRLETSGYVPRRFIAAEPLLEHGMSLALGYVDAMSVKRSLESGHGQRP